MARKAKGLYKRGNVWWCAYKSLTGKVVRVSTGFTDYDKAVDFLVKRKADVIAGIEPEIKKVINYTFNELEAEYSKWCERQRGFSKKQGFIKQLKGKFGDLPLKCFNTMLVEQYQTERTKKGNKPASVNRIVAVLKHMFTKANEWEMVDDQVYKKVRQVKLLEANNRRLRFLSKEECKSLIDACNDHLKPIIITALNTGMRKGEILSLKWDKNVDLRHGFILLEVTKNGERREIHINDTLKDVFLSLPRRIDGGHVFYDPITGKPYQDVKRSFASALKRAKITDFKFHDLRHTFASHLVMAGVDITTVKELLGHKSLTMTLRYAHLAPNHKSKALDILDQTLNENSTSHLLHNSEMGVAVE